MRLSVLFHGVVVWKLEMLAMKLFCAIIVVVVIVIPWSVWYRPKFLFPCYIS